ncbi:tetratricopeptide repeat protein [Okeania sp.]|uniref:tetratricopeptide repeat protein n=1 Tax=Okeania sp. TaxID=3100323 RepID=UPI002B4B22E6|nr:tetratricopeptide repeat protein [Okeania sp.]MEB3341289.1 tetratricopeptide repeat protein [Okeania sp.]
MGVTTFARGNQLLQEGKLEEAIAAYQKSIEENPQFIHSYQNLAKVLEQVGRIDEAIAALRQAVAINLQTPLLLYNLGRLFKRQGQFQEAVDYFRQAIALKQDVPDFYLGLASVLVKLGQWSEVEDCLNQMTVGKLDATSLPPTPYSLLPTPHLPDIYFYLAEAKSGQQQWSEAVEYYQRSWDIDSGRVDCGIGLAKALGKLGRWSEAVELYREIVYLSNSSGEVLCSLGQALAQLGRWSEAVGEYRKAIDLGCAGAEVRHHLGYAHTQLGRWEEAVVEYRLVREVNPKSAVVRHQLGYALMRLERWREAEIELRISAELYPGSAVVWQQLGDVLRELGEKEKAVEAYQQAIACNHDFYQAHHNLGENLEELERWEEAIAAYQRSVELKPQAASHQKLSRVLRKVGRVEEAENSENQAVTIESKLAELTQNGHGINENVSTTTNQTTHSSLTLDPSGSLKLNTSESENILVSIIIPVYEHHLFTINTILSIVDHTDLTNVELIIADDASPTPVEKVLADLDGLKILRNKNNLGFLKNSNEGMKAAKGDYLVILNNDIKVTAGWLPALLDVFLSHNDAGLVGAKLVYPDGTLQEAGSIVWRDGSAWNWGRGKDALIPHFNYVRKVDYCSGACLMIRRQDWLFLNGFDDAFSPGYYEDTDLAFRVRSMGKHVYYQPHSVIVHYEGISHGKDVNAGIKKHQIINKKRFYSRWQETLKTHQANGIEPFREVDRYVSARVLFIEAEMITPDKDSGSFRTEKMLNILVNLNCKVVFVPDNLLGNQPYLSKLQAGGIEVLHTPFVTSIEEYIKLNGDLFDVVFLCRHYIAIKYIDHIRKYAPKAKIIFDTVDLHYLREERHAKLEKSNDLMKKARITRDQELKVIQGADMTLVVSPVEKNELKKMIPDARVDILSNIHDVCGENPPDFYAMRDILFVGGFSHPPNVDGITWFIQEIFPSLQAQIPDINLDVVGSNMPEKLKKISQPGINMHGFVEDLKPFFNQAKIVIAPLRYGAGVKGKVNQAQSWGIPVVGTSVAIEGMYLSDEVDVLIADEPETFVRQIVRLYNNSELWKLISEGGRKNVQQHFSRAKAQETLKEIIFDKIDK